MSKNYIQYQDGRVFVIDMDGIMKWCLKSKDNPVKESEVTEAYDMEDDSNVGSKVVRELKSPNTQDDTIRYDFVKTLLTPFLNDVFDVMAIGNDFHLSLMFNTLIDMGFIKEIK